MYGILTLKCDYLLEEVCLSYAGEKNSLIEKNNYKRKKKTTCSLNSVSVLFFARGALLNYTLNLFPGSAL